MSVYWLQPLAWWGLAALLAPALIHLLARRESRRLLFPSLRFLRVTRLTALRRRIVSDWPLLVIRLLLLTAAVAALAAPVWISAARRASWSQRTARAIVMVGTPAEIAGEEARGSYVSAIFSAVSAADAIRSARLWLDRQPPAAQELVVVGDLREGSIAQRDLDLLPPHVGIRFLPTPGQESESAVTLRAVADVGGRGTAVYDVEARAGQTATISTHVLAANAVLPPIAISAAPAESAYANAVLRAVLGDGIMLRRHGDRRVRVVFPGGEVPTRLGTPTEAWAREALEKLAGTRGGEANGELTVVAPIAATAAAATTLLSRVLEAVYADPLAELEPRRISVDTLAAWSRPVGDAPQTTPPADEGDRRWLWGAALSLLVVEQLFRRQRTPAEAEPSLPEVRVA